MVVGGGRRDEREWLGCVVRIEEGLGWVGGDG